MAYTVHQAKTHFSRLLKEAEAGQEVVVMRGSKPVARIVAIDGPPANRTDEDVLSRRRLVGMYSGQITWTEDAFDPITDDELREWGMDYLADAPLVNPENPQPPLPGSE
jgi:prevent-host-death family protein